MTHCEKALDHTVSDEAHVARVKSSSFSKSVYIIPDGKRIHRHHDEALGNRVASALPITFGCCCETVTIQLSRVITIIYMLVAFPIAIPPVVWFHNRIIGDNETVRT